MIITPLSKSNVTSQRDPARLLILCGVAYERAAYCILLLYIQVARLLNLFLKHYIDEKQTLIPAGVRPYLTKHLTMRFYCHSGNTKTLGKRAPP